MSRALGSAAWPELVGQRPWVALPLGSCEQHGPHLPLDTDTRIAVALAERLAAARPDVIVAPPLTIGASWEHAEFPGLLSITNDLLASMLTELGRSAEWSAGLVLVNGHGGNTAGVSSAVAMLRGEGRRIMAWSPQLQGGDAHAGRTETSLMLALDPDAVRLPQARPGWTGPTAQAFTGGLRAASPTGVLGDPTGATVEEGASLLARLGDDLVHVFDEWRTGTTADHAG